MPVLSLLLLVGAAAVMTAPTAAAQNTAQSTAERDETLTRHATADRIARSAILTLRSTDPPMPIDYQVCAEQLGVALLLRPNDPHILRAMREALYRAGDLDGFNEATRRLAVVEPQDTVLQLSVISARITSIQNADDRLAAYERLLSAEGSGIDNSVKSRLAFDASVLAEELGDTDRFQRMLTMALQLDSTNKQAAARAADFFLAREDDPKGRIEILANVILADPLDPAAHLNLAREFLRYGATHAGQRFMRNAVTINRSEGIGQDESSLLQRYALQWLHEGGQAVLDELQQLEDTQRFIIAQQRKAAEEAGEDPDQVPPFKPEPVMERVRLAVASAEGIDEISERAMLNIEKGIRDIILNAQEALESDDPPSEAAVEEIITNLLVESLYLRLWSGQQIDKAEATLVQLTKIRGERSVKPESIERFRGWLAARQGEADKAQRLLEQSADRELFAMLGLGVAAETIDDRRAAMRAYAKAALAEPGTLMSVWAQKRLERMLGTSVTPTPQALELERFAATLPTSIDRLILGPKAYLDFNSSLVSNDLDRLGRVLLRLSVRNVGPIPLAVGERSPIRTSALAIPRINASGLRVAESSDPEVLSLNRRLRLMPKEAMTFDVWVGAGSAGALLDVETAVQATLRIRTILGFEIDNAGQYALSASSLDTETLAASRPRLGDLGDNTEDVVLAIEYAESGEDLLMTLLKARSLLLLTSTNTNASDAQSVQEAVCQAIAVRYETMTPDERAFTLTMMPPVQAIPESQIIDDLASESTDPLLIVLRLRRILDPDNPQFAQAMASDDPMVRRLGKILFHRLDRARRIRERDSGASADGGDSDEP